MNMFDFRPLDGFPFDHEMPEWSILGPTFSTQFVSFTPDAHVVVGGRRISLELLQKLSPLDLTRGGHLFYPLADGSLMVVEYEHLHQCRWLPDRRTWLGRHAYDQGEKLRDAIGSLQVDSRRSHWTVVDGDSWDIGPFGGDADGSIRIGRDTYATADGFERQCGNVRATKNAAEPRVSFYWDDGAHFTYIFLGDAGWFRAGRANFREIKWDPDQPPELPPHPVARMVQALKARLTGT